MTMKIPPFKEPGNELRVIYRFHLPNVIGWILMENYEKNSVTLLNFILPRHPVISNDVWDVQSPPHRTDWIHYHSEVIGSLRPKKTSGTSLLGPEWPRKKTDKFYHPKTSGEKKIHETKKRNEPEPGHKGSLIIDD